MNSQVKQYSATPALLKSLPEISAKCWAVFDGETGEIIYGKNYFVQAEIASLTKIMTCYVVLRFLEKDSLDWTNVCI